MSSAIELIVDGYARVKDRQSLEELRIHRRRLAGDLKAWVGFDCRLSIAQIEQDIAAIEAVVGSDRRLKLRSHPYGGVRARRASAAIVRHGCPHSGLPVLVCALPDV